MKSKRVVIWATLLVLWGLCGVCGTTFYIRNRPYLTDPPQDSLDITEHRDIRKELGPSDLDVLYTLAREVVDKWAPDAYLYGVDLTTSCTDPVAPKRARFAFLKVNHLDIYPKQWQAFVNLDLEGKKVRFQVEKEERDPPPPLQRHIDLSRLRINLLQAIEFARQVETESSVCREVKIDLYQNVWDISYVDEPVYLGSERYPGVKIDALTGEVQWKQGKK
jgi:hypothetical protein